VVDVCSTCPCSNSDITRCSGRTNVISMQTGKSAQPCVSFPGVPTWDMRTKRGAEGCMPAGPAPLMVARRSYPSPLVTTLPTKCESASAMVQSYAAVRTESNIIEPTL